MAKKLVKKHLMAIELRKQGQSYSQIKKRLEVSKSSLSLWLRRLPLTKKRIRELRDFSEQRIERFRNTMKAKREARMDEVYHEEWDRLTPLSEKEAYIAGLFLYWGEGAKTTPYETSLSNTNPDIVRFFRYWLTNCLHIPKEKIIVRLHLYSDMDGLNMMRFWSKTLSLPIGQFRNPYIKQTTLRGLTYKGYSHGTCNLIVEGGNYIRKIVSGIKVIDNFIQGNSLKR
ncbi:hypothetical protein HZB78_03225 [Candidatus Collierbacteria bacterium]|nr:hypothetical protein [Candidatus Collierbacteria bacterium]